MRDSARTSFREEFLTWNVFANHPASAASPIDMLELPAMRIPEHWARASTLPGAGRFEAYGLMGTG
jgi:hypothetical protein